MMPPIKAPSGWPNPPTMAAMKPEIANGTPTLNAVYCVGVISTPAIAPSPADSANDSDSIRETLMPWSDAASRLKAQARIALPVLVRLKNWSSRTISSNDMLTIQRN